MSSVSSVIETLGFESVKAFQRAWNLGVALEDDGVIGPKTTRAARLSEEKHHAKLPDISLSFSAKQFQCHCRGDLPGCQNTLIYRGVLASLEDMARHFGRAPAILDGYRCPRHNASVGGVSGSQHLFGTAVDLTGSSQPLARVRALDTWSGIGAKKDGAHRVTHVDRRDLLPKHNTTHSTRRAPAIWYYPGA